MASRLVIRGVGNNNFEPDREITRAEFAAVLCSTLGLQQGKGDNPFTDISDQDWFGGYINTAYEYKLISGIDANTFAPNAKIAREQATAMIARAMKITNLKAELKDSEINALIANYSDEAMVSDYAKPGIATCLKTGIITGRTSSTIAPLNSITRAEVAVIVQRLLQKSDLI